MTRDDDFIGQLEGYLDEYEGSTPLPDEVRDAIRAQLPSTQQRPAWWPAWRFPEMNSCAEAEPRGRRCGGRSAPGLQLPRRPECRWSGSGDPTHSDSVPNASPGPLRRLDRWRPEPTRSVHRAIGPTAGPSRLTRRLTDGSTQRPRRSSARMAMAPTWWRVPATERSADVYVDPCRWQTARSTRHRGLHRGRPRDRARQTSPSRGESRTEPTVVDGTCRGGYERTRTDVSCLRHRLRRVSGRESGLGCTPPGARAQIDRLYIVDRGMANALVDRCLHARDTPSDLAEQQADRSIRSRSTLTDRLHDRPDAPAVGAVLRRPVRAWHHAPNEICRGAGRLLRRLLPPLPDPRHRGGQPRARPPMAGPDRCRAGRAPRLAGRSRERLDGADASGRDEEIDQRVLLTQIDALRFDEEELDELVLEPDHLQLPARRRPVRPAEPRVRAAGGSARQRGRTDGGHPRRAGRRTRQPDLGARPRSERLPRREGDQDDAGRRRPVPHCRRDGERRRRRAAGAGRRGRRRLPLRRSSPSRPG